MLGVAATHAAHSKVLVTGVTGLVAGAMAMAAGEYVSVYFQGTWESSSLLADGALAKWEASQELEVPFFQQMARAE